MVDEYEWFFKIGVMLIIVFGKSEKAIDVIAKIVGSWLMAFWLIMNITSLIIAYMK